MLKSYKCHKEVLARPMTRGEYNEYRGWTIPEDEDPSDQGYLVEYPDSPTTGMPEGHTNYISWSPKEQFDNGYFQLPEQEELTGIMRYFAYKHLPEKLQKVSKPVGDLALLMNELPDGPEKSAGLRKLLEAKDCFVRSALG